MSFIRSGLLMLAVLALAAVPGRAAMNHDMEHATGAAYSDKAFLSGMIAHHEGAVEMARIMLNLPADQIDPQVAAWAGDILATQEKEIARMQDMLKTMGGMDDAAYAAMRKSMQVMVDSAKGQKNLNLWFVRDMLPHHGSAILMSVPALENSSNAAVLDLAEHIVTVQAKEMRAFRGWLLAHRAS